jgi:excisionase family DNA binding protein
MREDELPELLTPREARAVLGLSQSAFYARLQDGDIPSIRIGRRYRIPKDALLNNLLPTEPLRHPIEEGQHKKGRQRGRTANGQKRKEPTLMESLVQPPDEVKSPQRIPLSEFVYDPCVRKFFYVPTATAWMRGGVNVALAYLNLPVKPSKWLEAHPSPNWKAEHTMQRIKEEWAYDPVRDQFLQIQSGESYRDAFVVDQCYSAIVLDGKRIKPSVWLKREATR